MEKFFIHIFSVAFILNLSAQNFTHFEHYDTSNGLPSNAINAMEGDEQGGLWIGTQQGLCYFKKNQSFRHPGDALDSSGLSAETINALQRDQDGILWMGTDHALIKFDPNTDQVTKFFYKNNPLPAERINALAVDKNNIIWFGTEGNGLFAYYRQSGNVVHFLHDEKDETSLSGNHITVLYLDNTGNLWIGTRDAGLNVLIRKTNHFVSFLHQAEDSCSLAGNHVTSILMDSRQRIWVGTTTGLCCKKNGRDISEGHFCPIFMHDHNNAESISSNHITCIGMDQFGKLWIGTNEAGLNRLALKYLDQLYPHMFIPYLHKSDQTYSISSNVVQCIYKDRSGLLWIGTNNGLNSLNQSLQAINEVGLFFKNIATEFDKALFPKDYEKEQKDSMSLCGLLKYGKVSVASQVKIFLLDEENNVLDSVVTNEEGLFTFNKILPDEAYIFQVKQNDELLSSHARIFILNSNGESVVKIMHAGRGFFHFKTLSPERYAQLPVLKAESPGLITISVYGQIFKKLPGDYADSVHVILVNDAGQILYSATTDKAGRFVFHHLPPESKYSFKVKGEAGNFMLVITDERGKVIQKIKKDSKDVFHYQRLKSDESSLIHLVDENDVKLVLRPDEKFIVHNIYYDYNDFSLNESSKKELDKLIVLLKKNKTLGVKICSHTDNRGDETYNLKLSQKRSDACIQYLVNHNIAQMKLRGIGYGETQPINPCRDETSCTEDQHALNRRTEFVFFELN